MDREYQLNIKKQLIFERFIKKFSFFQQKNQLYLGQTMQNDFKMMFDETS